MSDVLLIDRLDQAQKLIELYQQVEADIHAPLYQHRKERGYRAVSGEGRPDARILFVGDAPGPRETVFGRPFIGPAGELLHHLLKMAQINRHHVYLTNLVKDRIPKDQNPTPHEVAYYGRYFEEEVNTLQPLLIAPMGEVTVTYTLQYFQALPTSEDATDLYGQVLDGFAPYGHVKIVPLLHPASALYDVASLTKLSKDMRVIERIAREAGLLN